MRHKEIRFIPGFLGFLIIMNSCSAPLEWPKSPLYLFEQSASDTALLSDREKVLNEITGHYL